jgi:hypothetical protein
MKEGAVPVMIDMLNQPFEITSRMSEAALLERRLEDGYARIEEAKLSGADTTAWEAFWVKLLLEYQSVCDELTQAA